MPDDPNKKPLPVTAGLSTDEVALAAPVPAAPAAPADLASSMAQLLEPAEPLPNRPVPLPLDKLMRR